MYESEFLTKKYTKG